MAKELPQFYTIQEVAAALNVHPKTITRMIERGDLDAVKIGAGWRIAAADVQVLTKPQNHALYVR